jgi:hypothetical protein
MCSFKSRLSRIFILFIKSTQTYSTFCQKRFDILKMIILPKALIYILLIVYNVYVHTIVYLYIDHTIKYSIINSINPWVIMGHRVIHFFALLKYEN